MTPQAKTTLTSMLTQYRASQRGLPTYEELASLISQDQETPASRNAAVSMEAVASRFAAPVHPQVTEDQIVSALNRIGDIAEDAGCEALPITNRVAFDKMIAVLSKLLAANASGLLNVGTLAWALITPTGNIRYWSHDRQAVEAHQAKCPNETLAPIIGAAASVGDLPDVGEMVNRFLGWPLPKTFGPDCGISFDGRNDDEWNKNKSWPVGTNLLTADEAKAMFEYCIEEKAK